MHNRRSFITKTALAATALSTSRVMGANDKIRVACIGMGGRGMTTAKWFEKEPGVEIATVCDVDTKQLDIAKEAFPKAKTEQDLRKVMEDDSIDAIAISTGNHWHALASIWACQAGKDVYVEKPVSHNIWEGRKIVEAARKYDRIVQGGTQQRSDEMHDELKAFLDSGRIGKMKYVRCNRYGLRKSIGGPTDKPVAPPETVDYDLWLGPAQDVPIYRPQFHYDWHWDWNCGNGELGNWGPHIIDDLRSVVFRDKISLPKRVIAGGGRLAWHDAGETPNTHFVYMDTGDVPVIVDVHNLPRSKGVKAADNYKRRRTNAFMIVECEDGYLTWGRGGGAAFDPDGKSIVKFKGDAGKKHAKNFFDAMRSRKKEDLKGEIEQIHYSSAWCHLGNLSYRLGSEYSRDKAEASVKNFEPWNDVIGDFHEHLVANEIDPKNEKIMLGADLTIDVENETFSGDSATPEALALVKGKYRDPFVVPESV